MTKMTKKRDGKRRENRISITYSYAKENFVLKFISTLRSLNNSLEFFGNMRKNLQVWGTTMTFAKSNLITMRRTNNLQTGGFGDEGL